jgi:hypothetical protein
MCGWWLFRFFGFAVLPLLFAFSFLIFVSECGSLFNVDNNQTNN